MTTRTRGRAKPRPERIRAAAERALLTLAERGRALYDAKTGEPVLDAQGKQRYVPPSAADWKNVLAYLRSLPPGNARIEDAERINAWAKAAADRQRAEAKRDD